MKPININMLCKIGCTIPQKDVYRCWLIKHNLASRGYYEQTDTVRMEINWVLRFKDLIRKLKKS